MQDILKKMIKGLVTDVGTNNATKRDQWIMRTLARLPAGTRLLDAGAGTQRYRSFCSHLHYVSQDFCEYKGKGDGIGMQTGSWDTTKIDIVSDIVAIPEENGSFGAVLCTEVLEHIPDPIKALKEFRRLLRPVGELIITAPFCSITHMAPYHYYTGFNRYFYEHHLREAGFQIAEIVTNGYYSEYIGQELRRLLTMYDSVPTYIKITIAILLRFLGVNRSRISAKGDLLCYGYHVRAFKQQ